MTQVVERLLCKFKALSSNLSPTTNKESCYRGDNKVFNGFLITIAILIIISN
jgi:hypothetical protein